MHAHQSIVPLLILLAMAVDSLRGQAPSGPGIPHSLYVSTSGSNANPGTKTLPVLTIGHALSLATSYWNQGRPVTINVGPGTYTLASLPNDRLRIPARGLTLEALGPTQQPVVISSASTGAELVWVDRDGDPSMAPTKITGIVFSGGSFGVRIYPATPTIGVATTAVEVRRCTFLNYSQSAVRVEVAGDRRAENIIEECSMTATAYSAGGRGLAGIEINKRATRYSSTLVRSNYITGHEIGVFVYGTEASPRDCRPRLESNTFWRNQWHVDAWDCEPWIVNNTMVNAEPLVNGGQTAAIQMRGTTQHVLYALNNILWNPIENDNEFRFLPLGNNATQTIALNNDIEDPGSPFLMAAYDMALGYASLNRRVAPNFVNAGMADFRLSPNNPQLIDSGRIAVPGSSLSVAPVGMLPVGNNAFTVRCDVPVDVERDPRFISADTPMAVDIGSDEVTGTRIQMIGDPSINLPPDLHGNMSIGVQELVRIRGPLNGLASLYLGFGWSADQPPYQNLLAAPFGNWLLSPLATDHVFLATYLLPASTTNPSIGEAAAPIVLPAPHDVDYYIQALTFRPDPDSPGGYAPADASNRIRLQAN